MGDSVSFGQSNTIETTYEELADGSYALYAENTSHTIYTISLTFNKLENSRSFVVGDTYYTAIGRGRKQIAIMRPEFIGKTVSFSYKTSYRIGDMTIKPDTNFVYLFPLQKGKKVEVRNMISIKASITKQDDNIFTGNQFMTNKGDTIVASRAGLVGEIKDDVPISEKIKKYDQTENFVRIHHADGTFAKYILFKLGGIFVKPGDRVIAGQPLGIIDGSDYQSGSHLSFSVTISDIKYITLVPIFFLAPDKIGKISDKESYISQHPEEFITLEMSKKEKKKYLSNKAK